MVSVTDECCGCSGVVLTVSGCTELEARDKRFYCRALWNFALRDNSKELDIDFNGIDFGHSNLYENLQ